MNTKSRIASIAKANSLDFSITGFQRFNLSELQYEGELAFQLPTNIRLGHLAERIVSELIKASSNYKMRYENVQLLEGKRTIGEIDFILEEAEAKQLIHMEFAYKFYLFDPSLSVEPISNWIGPNRNDSLKQKLEKLKEKQFPLLYHDCARAKFKNIEIDKATQSLCLLVSLFIPYEYKGSFSPIYAEHIKGYYLRYAEFLRLDDAAKSYYLPSKLEWGMDASENEDWSDNEGIGKQIALCISEKQAPLCWQKCRDTYEAFFIVWW